MFINRAAAREALAESCFDNELEALLGALEPVIAFKPTGEPHRPGGLQLGGEPDLGPGMAWPLRAAYALDDPIFKAGGPNHEAHLAKYGAGAFPFQFLAQLNLGEVQAVGGDLVRVLPDRGRLLFFYDGQMGPWTGLLPGGFQRAGHVIWDQTPQDELRPQPTHPLLIADEAENDEEMLAEARKTPEEKFAANRALYEAAGLTAADLAGPNEPQSRDEILAFNWRNRSPAQRVSVQRMLTLPAREAVEARVSPVIKDVLADDEMEACYMEQFGWGGSFYSEARNGWLLQRMLGAPVPVQDDPRFDAVPDMAAGNPEAWADPAFQRRMQDQALTRVVLLQLDLATLMQRRVEGIVYFCILKADLAARDFSKVHAVYQQS